ncbi:MAG: hypothetical protein ACP5SF_04020 [Thermoplasmata archaeon]
MPDLVDEINSLIRSEKVSRSKLRDIPDSFFKNANSELKRLKEELKNAVEKNQIDYMTQIRFKIKAIENGIKELKWVRGKKIAFQAIEDSVSGTRAEMNSLIAEERILYEEFKRSFDFYLSGDGSPIPIGTKIENEIKKEENLEHKKEIIKKIPVRILYPMEVADLDRDYVFYKEDIVTISEALAIALSKKGMCEIIQKSNQ